MGCLTDRTPARLGYFFIKEWLRCSIILSKKTASINDQIILDGEIAHRIVKVRRSQVSDEIELVDAEHNAYVAVIMALKGNEVLVKVVREAVLNPELPVSSTIVVGTSKGDKNEFIIQKATEMGVQHIIFFLMQTTQFHASKVIR
ncbi:RsmE family RNA methyltransferase [Amylolactobacillus amylophilus]|uniref:RsmE family RNA methyltransferase n=1 Tax=Amylolactobacillus amylophilus TaxID=1603 RepID=UPI0006CF611D|nr:RsmE family RNA methyltransferase [Amylolactobacillus amylophilus]